MVFGQLTAGGEPIPFSQFVIGVSLEKSGLTSERLDETKLLPRKSEGEGTYYVYYVNFNMAFDADGAQIYYVLHSVADGRPTGILSYNITTTDFTEGPFLGLTDITDVVAELKDLRGFFHLPFLPVDPPGEGHVGFF